MSDLSALQEIDQLYARTLGAPAQQGLLSPAAIDTGTDAPPPARSSTSALSEIDSLFDYATRSPTKPTQNIADLPNVPIPAPPRGFVANAWDVGVSSTQRIGASLAGAVDYLLGGTAVTSKIRDYLNSSAESRLDKLDPAARRAYEASFFLEGTDNPLNTPATSLGYNLAAAVPSIVSFMLPGGLVAKGLGYTARAVRAGTATHGQRLIAQMGADAAAQGAVSVGEVANGILQAVREEPRQQLMRYPVFREYMRKNGGDEQAAREAYARDITGSLPLYAGVFGALAGAMAPYIMAGPSSASLARGALRGAGVGGGGMALQEGTVQLFSELGRELGLGHGADWNRIISATASSALTGGILGGAVGGLAARNRPHEAVPPDTTTPMTAADVRAAAEQPELPLPPGRGEPPPAPDVPTPRPASPDGQYEMPWGSPRPASPEGQYELPLSSPRPAAPEGQYELPLGAPRAPETTPATDVLASRPASPDGQYEMPWGSPRAPEATPATDVPASRPAPPEGQYELPLGAPKAPETTPAPETPAQRPAAPESQYELPLGAPRAPEATPALEATAPRPAALETTPAPETPAQRPAALETTPAPETPAQRPAAPGKARQSRPLQGRLEATEKATETTERTRRAPLDAQPERRTEVPPQIEPDARSGVQPGGAETTPPRGVGPAPRGGPAISATENASTTGRPAATQPASEPTTSKVRAARLQDGNFAPTYAGWRAAGRALLKLMKSAAGEEEAARLNELAVKYDAMQRASLRGRDNTVSSAEWDRRAELMAGIRAAEIARDHARIETNRRQLDADASPTESSYQDAMDRAVSISGMTEEAIGQAMRRAKGYPVPSPPDAPTTKWRGGTNLNAPPVYPGRKLTPEEIQKVAAELGLNKPREEGRPLTAEEKAQIQQGTPDTTRAILDAMPTDAVVVASTKLRDLYRTLESDMGEDARILSRVLRRLVGNVPVTIVDSPTLAKIRNGIYAAPVKGDTNSAGSIFIIRDGLSLDLVRTALHEGVHAATVARLSSDPKLLSRIDTLRGYIHLLARSEAARQFFGDEYLQRAKFYYRDAPEFLAEAFTDRQFQFFLENLPVTNAMRERLGLFGKLRNMWMAFIESIRRSFNVRPEYYSALDAAISLGSEAFAAHKRSAALFDALHQGIIQRTAVANKVLDDAVHPLREMAGRIGYNMPPAIRQRLLSVTNIHQMVQRYDARLFGGALSRFEHALRARSQEARDVRNSGEDIVRAMGNLPLEQRTKLYAVMNDSSAYELRPDLPLSAPENAHIKNDNPAGRQAAREYARLHADYQQLSAAAKQAFQQSQAHYAKLRADYARSMVEKIIRETEASQPSAVGPWDVPAMTRRILNDAVTSLDAERLGGEEAAADIVRLAMGRRIRGTYTPLRGQGNYVVVAHYDGPSVVRHSSLNDALKFADTTDRKITGTHREAFDPATGARVDLDDPAVPNKRIEWVTNLTPYEVHFAKTPYEAKLIADALRERGLKPENPQLRRTPSLMQRLAPDHIKRIVDRVNRLPIEEDRKSDTVRTLLEAETYLMADQGRADLLRLRRRGTSLGDIDAREALAKYTNTAANVIAYNRWGVQLREAMAELEHRATFIDDQNAVTRGQVVAELKQHAAMDPSYAPDSKTSRAVQAIQHFTFATFLASPSFTVLQALQPYMTAMPIMGGRHGLASAFGAMLEASRLTGGALTLGARELLQRGRELAGGAQVAPRSMFDIGLANLKRANPHDAARLVDMLTTISREGKINAHQGSEVLDVMRGDTGRVGSFARKLAELGYAMPGAVEVKGRMDAAIAAYRMEYARTANHEAAIKYASDMLSTALFDYSAEARPRLFNRQQHPYLSAALTFRTFAQGMYGMFTHLVMEAVRGSSPQVRAEARRALAYVIGAHALMVGGLGITPEPIKWGMVAVAFLMGEREPFDYEAAVRRIAASVLGPTVGAAVSEGIPHALGIGLRSRVGLDNLLLGRVPRSFSAETTKGALFDLIAGAPGAAVASPFRAYDKLLDGDMMAAAEGLLPVKFLADLVRAGGLAVNGITDKHGTQIVPASLGDVMSRAVGFRSAHEADIRMARAAIQGAVRERSADRAEALLRIGQAQPGERLTLLADFNKGRTAADRITMSDVIRHMRAVQKAQQSPLGLYLPPKLRQFRAQGAFLDAE